MSTTYTTNYHLGKQEDTSDNFNMSVITENMDIIDTALSGKQATLTTTQLSAVNSGIDSTKVAQIETNKNNILLNQETLYQYVDNADIIMLNGFNKSDFEVGYYYTTNGGKAASNDWSINYNYIPVKPNGKYAFAFCYNQSSTNFYWVDNPSICWYDKDKNYISLSNSGHAFTAPQNARYVRLSLKNMYNEYPMFYEYDGEVSVPTHYISYSYSTNDNIQINIRIDELKNEVEETSAKNILLSTNLYDKSIAIDNKYINFSSGGLGNSNQSILSGYFPVEEGKTYCVSNGANYYCGAIVFYKKSGSTYTKICGRDKKEGQYGSIPECTGLVTMSGNKEIVFTIENGSQITHAMWYITDKSDSGAQQFNYYGNHTTSDLDTILSGVKVNESSQPYTYEPFTKGLNSTTVTELMQLGNTLYNKSLVVCGDSITYGADMDNAGIRPDGTRMCWGWQIANRNKMKYYNDGVSGSTMQGIAEKNGFSCANGRYTKLPDEIDYLIIWFGWNDTAYGTLGTINDNTNETYYGGYNVVIPYLQNKYPYAKICLIVPFGCDVDHRNAVRELCNKWGLACFDMYGTGTPLYYGKEASVGVDASVVTANQAKFQANGAHPNYKGHTQLADMIEQFIRGI